MGGKSLARGVLLLFLIPKGNEFNLFPFFVALFPQKHGIFMEFLILIFGKDQIVEVILYGKFFI